MNVQLALKLLPGKIQALVLLVAYLFTFFDNSKSCWKCSKICETFSNLTWAQHFFECAWIFSSVCSVQRSHSDVWSLVQLCDHSSAHKVFITRLRRSGSTQFSIIMITSQLKSRFHKQNVWEELIRWSSTRFWNAEGVFSGKYHMAEPLITRFQWVTVWK